MRFGAENMNKCLTVPVFTKEALIKLRNFSMAQQELSKELVLAQPLGICKITTYVDPKSNFKNLDLTWRNGKNSLRTVTILTKDDLKEMLSSTKLKEMNS